MRVYNHKGLGTISLYVDGILRAHTKYNTVHKRKEITTSFIDAATRFNPSGDVYILLRHYQVIKNTKPKSKNVYDIPRTKIPQLEVLEYTRPKAEYSNPTFAS